MAKATKESAVEPGVADSGRLMALLLVAAPKESALSNRRKSRVVCMIAYANYYTDARIKNYVQVLLKRGYEVDVFGLGSDDGTTTPGLCFFPVMQKYWGDSSVQYALSQLRFALLVAVWVGWRYFKKRYSLVHVHNMPNFLVFSAIFAKLMGAKVILDVHDTMPEAYATKFDCSLDHPLIALLRWEERLSARFADRVITTNELHKMVLSSHGIPDQKIDIIMNLGDERIFRPTQSGTAREGLTLGYHGTIAERLGIDLILRAIHLAAKD